MDSSQNRPSGLPRPSRLPVPKSVSSIPRPVSTNSPSIPRPSPSVDRNKNNFVGQGDLQSPKLRAPTSRSQLRTSTTSAETAISSTPSRSSTASRNSSIRPAAIGAPSRNVSTPQRRTSAFTSRSVSRTSQFSAIDIPQASPSRQDQFIHADNISPVEFAAEDEYSPVLDDTSPVDEAFGAPKPRSNKPRPSLSDRTVETLARLPSSPAVTRKPSSFYEQGRPSSRAGSVGSRPGSSYNSDGSARPTSRTSSRQGSRPGSRGEHEDGTRIPANPFKSELSTIDATPEKKPTNTIRRDLATSTFDTPAPKLPSAPGLGNRSPSPNKLLGKTPTRNAAALTPRPLKTRSSVNGLAKKPSLPAMSKANAQRAMSKENDTKNGNTPGLTYRKSSAALREQIAQAKAAKRAASQSSMMEPGTPDEYPSPAASHHDAFSFDMNHSDPFGQRKNEPVGKQVLKQRVATARTTGKLNIAALGLPEMPEEVMNMYKLDSMDGAGGNWAESVDLTRLVAADNEFETLGDAIFPDVSLEELEQNEEAEPSIFVGLETMDLHGNKLSSLPIGFRHLANVTTLNLSSNCLSNDSLDVISQMKSLRDLKLARNKLAGELSSAITQMTGLEILDLQGNQLTSVGSEIKDMTRLKILNLGENALPSLPFAALATLPLSELNLRKNKLSDVLIEESSIAFSNLQTLDVSSNQLKRLVPTGGEIGLPALHTLSLSVNRLMELPDMTSWTSLLTLTADENSISVIPESFPKLTKLRQADFSGNDIRALPAEIARMDNLSMIRLSGNPLRDRKFITATTDEIKETLLGRLEPPPPYQEQGNITSLMGEIVDVRDKNVARGLIPVDDDASDGEDKFATPPTSAPQSRAHSRNNTLDETPAHLQPLRDDGWTVKAGGVLDRSNTESTSLPMSKCSDIARKQQVKQLQLHHNAFTTLPLPLSAFASSLTSLSLANNKLTGDMYLGETLELPLLNEINLVSNKMTSVEPLLTYLKAPKLERIDISFNRVATLPTGILETFPKLSILLAANNSFTELDPESIKGLKIVDVSNNDIGQLNPRIGLLGGVAGLDRLEVSGNRFKVPRWNILEQGTHATLRWLRGRVPREEMSEWRQANGEDSGEDVD